MPSEKKFILNKDDLSILAGGTPGSTAFSAIDNGEGFVVTGSGVKRNSLEAVNGNAYKVSNSSNSATKLYFNYSDTVDIDTIIDSIIEAIAAASHSDADGSTNWGGGTVDNFIEWFAARGTGQTAAITDTGVSPNVTWTLKKRGANNIQGHPTAYLQVGDPTTSTTSWTRGNIMKWSDSPSESNNLVYHTKMIDFGNPATRKNIKRVDITFVAPNADEGTHCQVAMETITEDGRKGVSFDDTKSYNYTAAKGLHLESATGTPGKEAVAKLKIASSSASSAKNVYACKIVMGILGQNPATTNIPADFTIEDITIVYKEKNA